MTAQSLAGVMFALSFLAVLASAIWVYVDAKAIGVTTQDRPMWTEHRAGQPETAAS